MTTLKKIPVSIEFVDIMPFDTIEENTLYVQKSTMRMRHICLCGCAGFIEIDLQMIDDNGSVIARDNKGWNLMVKDGKATITPSIFNHPCEGHYIITNGVANLV